MSELHFYNNFYYAEIAAEAEPAGLNGRHEAKEIGLDAQGEQLA
jgi:hypothetical protein